MEPSTSDNELTMYKDILVAGLDYYIHTYGNSSDIQINDTMTSLAKTYVDHCTLLKGQVHNIYANKKLPTLKRWFRDISEMAVAANDLNYQMYIEKATGHKIDLFDKFFARIDKIIQAGQIKSDSQYRNVEIMIDFLSGKDSTDDARITELDKLLFAYNDKRKLKP